MSENERDKRMRSVNSTTVASLTAKFELLQFLVIELILQKDASLPKGCPLFSDFLLEEIEDVAKRAEGNDALKCFAVEDFAKLLRHAREV